MVVNALLLAAAQMHHVWRPWFRGVITARFTDVLWVVDLSLAFEIAASAALLVAFRRWLRDALELARASIALVATVTYLTVYPFAFDRITHGLDAVAHLGLQIVLALTVVAILVNFTRLVYDRDEGHGGTHHAT